MHSVKMPDEILSCHGTSIHRIKLPEPAPGYKEFLTPWFIKLRNRYDHRNILIDPGPTFSIPSLAKGLEYLGVSDLHLVLLTHIHIDHAGGVGALSDIFPTAKILVHPRGYEHLISPDRLWQGSLQTLGKLAHAYGKILPVPNDRLIDALCRNHQIPQISVLDTPGHASHHLSFMFSVHDQRVLFSGEALGVFFQTPGENSIYLRPATPPRFFYDVSMNTLDVLQSTAPDMICCGHYGFTTDASTIFRLHKEQLALWRNTIFMHRQSSSTTIFDRLLEQDPLLKPFMKLNEDVREREKYFITNSITGFLKSFD